MRVILSWQFNLLLLALNLGFALGRDEPKKLTIIAVAASALALGRAIGGWEDDQG